jgi:tRNA threonylcarbamoyladenosine biosynthesis protein TsaE
MQTWISNSEEDSIKIAYEIFKNFNFDSSLPNIIFLEGVVGAGKTLIAKVLIKNFLKNFLESLTTESLVSPTYNLVKTYGEKNIVTHYDFYRLKSMDELYETGFEYYLEKSKLIIIEWGDLIKELKLILKSYPYFEVKIEITTKNTRKISLFKISP